MNTTVRLDDVLWREHTPLTMRPEDALGRSLGDVPVETLIAGAAEEQQTVTAAPESVTFHEETEDDGDFI